MVGLAQSDLTLLVGYLTSYTLVAACCQSITCLPVYLACLFVFYEYVFILFTTSLMRSLIHVWLCNGCGVLYAGRVAGPPGSPLRERALPALPPALLLLLLRRVWLASRGHGVFGFAAIRYNLPSLMK